MRYIQIGDRVKILRSEMKILRGRRGEVIGRKSGNIFAVLIDDHETLPQKAYSTGFNEDRIVFNGPHPGSRWFRDELLEVVDDVLFDESELMEVLGVVM